MGRTVDHGRADYLAFVEAHQHRLLRAAYLVCGNRHQAEDLLQDALLKLALRWPAVREIEGASSMHLHGHSGQHDQGWLTQPTPEEIYTWLGVKFATLEAPYYRSRLVGRTWETAGDHGDLHYAAVRLVHELDENTTIEVTTARDDTDGTSLGARLRECLTNYQFGQLGRLDALPWGAGPPPREFFERLEIDLPHEPIGTRAMSVDGEPSDWIYLTFPDMTTGQHLVACGGHIGTSLVMVTGTDTSVGTARLRMWPPPT
ncbi:sigma factor [Micromonospora sp. WMMD1128]|uniref:sigma factor n=1 Tax=Micromonospora sp. WMMD1128 TaxID=3015150 RepID=UPI00248C08E3|nr:sigma factor [Micromonospora sp. WMMD1128]WBB73641.1 sigma factor [Micromonospora sp. WMMD1128]